MAYIIEVVRSHRRHPASSLMALLALLAMTASTAATALALPCDLDCPEMAPATPEDDAHACCPNGGKDAEPDPSTAFHTTLPDCCTVIGATDTAPLLRDEVVEVSERSDDFSLPSLVAVRLPAPSARARVACGAGPAPPPPRVPTATTVLLL